MNCKIVCTYICLSTIESTPSEVTCTFGLNPRPDQQVVWPLFNLWISSNALLLQVHCQRPARRMNPLEASSVELLCHKGAQDLILPRTATLPAKNALRLSIAFIC
jgi:hypothetical protein